MDINAIKKWENYETPYILINGKKDIPFIQPIVENNEPNEDIIYHDDEVIVMFPKKEKSILHLLVFPKRRIFNVKTMNKTDIPLIEYMLRIGKLIAILFFIYPKHFLEIPISKKNLEIYMQELSKMDLKSTNFIAEIYNNINGFFHIYPRNSVNWLHMHIIYNYPKIFSKINFPVQKVIKLLSQNKEIKYQ